MKYKVEGYVHSASLTVSDDVEASYHCCFWMDIKQLERLRDDITVALREIDANQQKINGEAEKYMEEAS